MTRCAPCCSARGVAKADDGGGDDGEVAIDFAALALTVLQP